MAYELLVLDVDGTLVNTKKEITERTKEALWECQDQGIKVAIASGRCTEDVYKRQALCCFSRKVKGIFP